MVKLKFKELHIFEKVSIKYFRGQISNKLTSFGRFVINNNNIIHNIMYYSQLDYYRTRTTFTKLCNDTLVIKLGLVSK